MQPSLQVYSEAASVSPKRLSIFFKELDTSLIRSRVFKTNSRYSNQVVFVLLAEPYSVSLLSLASLKHSR